MSPATAARGRLGLVAAGVLTASLAARPVAESLRAAGGLQIAVGAAFIVLLLLAWSRLRARPLDPASPVPPALLLATLGAAAVVFFRWDLPEERMHLVLYAGLGLAAWEAIGGAGWRRSAAAGFGVAGFGLLDEGLQTLDPARQFDWMDVVANAVSGAVAPLLLLPGRAAVLAPALLLAFAVAFAPLQRIIGLPRPPTPSALARMDADPFGRGPDPSPVPPVPAAPPSALRPDAPYLGFDLLLITIDALRADHVPPVGRAPVATPCFDAFAAQSVAVSEFWAASSWTTPSMVSLLSGWHPALHGVASRGLEMAPEPLLPLERLAAAGWSVSGYAGDATETYRHLGIQRELPRVDPARDLRAALTPPGPAFVWLHLRDVHAPYDATPERLAALGLPSDLPDAPILLRARTSATVPRAMFPGRHSWLRPAIAALYAAEVADADATFGRVLAALEESGRRDRTIVVLTADHGEELLEGDGIGHASTTLDSVPRDEVQRIPLLVRFPDGVGAGALRQGSFRQQDLLPSLLPLLGLASPSPGSAGAPAGPVLASEALFGVDRGAWLRAGSPADPAPVWFLTSPCGWQCPPERRGERVAALRDRDGLWTWCRYLAGAEGARACAPPLAAWLSDGAALGAALGSPVLSPPPR